MAAWLTLVSTTLVALRLMLRLLLQLVPALQLVLVLVLVLSLVQVQVQVLVQVLVLQRRWTLVLACLPRHQPLLCHQPLANLTALR